MKHRIQRDLTITLTAVVFLGLIRICAAGEPLDLVKAATEGATAVLKDPKLKSPDKKKERIERLKEFITPLRKLHMALDISIRAGSPVVFRLKEVFARAICVSDPDL